RQREGGDGRTRTGRRSRCGRGRLGQRRQGRADRVLLRAVHDHQRDDQPDDRQDGGGRDDPQPARRLRAFRLGWLRWPASSAVLIGRVRVVAIGGVGGQLLGRRRRGRCLIGGAVG